MQPRIASCPICGETAGWPIPFRRRLEQGTLKIEDVAAPGYAWVLCRRCGNGYPTAQPDLGRLASAWNTAQSDAPLDPRKAAALEEFQRRFSRVNAERAHKFFAPLVNGGKPGRMLDVACGLGETAHCFTEHGWNVEGTDADPAMLRHHRERGIRSRIGQFEQMEFKDKVEFIHIAHAIYFMTDPMQTLRRATTLLNPSGILGLVLADFMAVFDPGQPSYVHTFYPTASSMRYALALAGFDTILTRRMSGSIYMAARSATVALPAVNVARIYRSYRTKPWRYALIGRPYRAARRLAKALLARAP